MLAENVGGRFEVERRSEAENRNLLQQIGNNSNAYTTEDRTAFFVNTTPPHLDQAVDLVTGWLLGAKITVPEYRREYQVVQRELEMGKGEPDREFYYIADMNRYHVSPARVPVIGTRPTRRGTGSRRSTPPWRYRTRTACTTGRPDRQLSGAPRRIGGLRVRAGPRRSEAPARGWDTWHSRRCDSASVPGGRKCRSAVLTTVAPPARRLTGMKAPAAATLTRPPAKRPPADRRPARFLVIGQPGVMSRYFAAAGAEADALTPAQLAARYDIELIPAAG